MCVKVKHGSFHLIHECVIMPLALSFSSGDDGLGMEASVIRSHLNGEDLFFSYVSSSKIEIRRRGENVLANLPASQ